MGNAESSGGGDGGCSHSSTQCNGGGGFVVAHDGHGFSIAADRDGHFTVSGGPYADASSRDTGASSDAHVHNMCADARAPVTEHTHKGSMVMSMAVDIASGHSSPEGTSMRHDAGQFHSHTHDPVRVSSVSIGTASPK